MFDTETSTSPEEGLEGLIMAALIETPEMPPKGERLLMDYQLKAQDILDYLFEGQNVQHILNYIKELEDEGDGSC